MSTPREKIAYCPRCRANKIFFFVAYCGAWLCDTCDYHERLARCFCGWSVSGRDGRRELIECGETIDGEGGAQ